MGALGGGCGTPVGERKAGARAQGFMCKQNSSDVILLHCEPRRAVIRFVLWGGVSGVGPEASKEATASVYGRARKISNQVRATV